jgi:predicted Zn finger-like uncharacterized protein
VVVVCESCSTRFQIDEARIPAKGTRVRCSRCKTTFFVASPTASFEDTVQEVVAEITDTGGRTVPELAEDLFDRMGDDLGETGSRPNGPLDDEAWEFDAEPAPKAPSPALAGSAPARAAHATAGPVLEEIGSPEDWDLLGDSVDATAREASFLEAPAPKRGPEPTPALAPERAPSRAVEVERSWPEPRVRQLGRTLASAGRTATRTVAWLALVLLFTLGVVWVLPASGTLVLPAAPAATVGFSDGEARGVRVRFVENAFVGTLFVVQGELARVNANPLLGLRAYWVDAEGARVGAGEWALPAPRDRELRERAPEALREQLAAAAGQTQLRGPFVALFEAVPDEALGFTLALEPLPTPPADAAPAPVEATQAEPTASSPPPPRPSSE